MPHTPRTLPDVFTAREIARAAGAAPSVVEDLIASGAIRSVDGEFVAWPDALDAARRLRAGVPFASAPAAAGFAVTPGALFNRARGARRSAGMPAAASAAVHGAMIGGLLLATLVPLGSSAATTNETTPPQPMRMVFLNLPGPGGGGGGGGMKLKRPATQARRAGESSLSSPIPERKPVPAEPAPKIEEPPPAPPTPPEPLPPVEAPVAARGADKESEAGVLERQPPAPPSRGEGEGGGAGTGKGVGLGEGQGSGIGDGEGGGEGGGPYRPGSGVQPPRLLSEVKPDYTEEARRRGLEGEVVLEIVVRHDGRVGDVRVKQGLGAGLDQQAVQAVRRWQFAAATRKGRPVDVVVEVAVEFKLR